MISSNQSIGENLVVSPQLIETSSTGNEDSKERNVRAPPPNMIILLVPHQISASLFFFCSQDSVVSSFIVRKAMQQEA